MSRTNRHERELAEHLNRALREGRGRPTPEPEPEEPESDPRSAEREARGVPRGEPAGNVDAGAGRRGDEPEAADLGSRLNAALRER